MNSIALEDQLVAVAPCNMVSRIGNGCHLELLPIELQTQIFTECVLGRLARFECSEAPITLLAVCKSWRILALSVPQLWSSFEICLEGSDSAQAVQAGERTLKEMKSWLERSRRRSLSFKVTYNPSITFQRSIDPILTRILFILSQQSHRWQHVEFYVPTAYLGSLLESSPHDFAALDSITLDAVGSRRAPHFLNFRALGIKWSQLTALRLNLDSEHLPDLDDCLGILSESVNLSSCVLSANCVFSDSDDIDSDQVVLPYLEEFRIVLQGCESNRSPESCLVSFLNKLELTMLKALHIEWLVRVTADPTSWSNYQPQFIGFMERLSPTLEILQLGYLPMLESHLLQCLSVVPYLTSLDLRCSLGDAANDPITDNFLTKLSFLNDSETWSYSWSTLLPLLQSLNLTCHGEAWTSSVISRFIDSRIRMNKLGHFRQLKLKMLRPTPECMTSQITNWKEAGISVTFQSVIIY